MVTLYAYILRELLKIFALTTVALTALFIMGGGLFNVMTQESISAGDVLGSLHLLIPIAVTLTMPISALFTATIVYGRFAADNEFVAVRSAGINIHRMFLPAMLLSVFVAVFTTISANFIIPDFVGQLTRYLAHNIGGLAEGRLKADGRVRWVQGDRHLLLSAEDASILSTADMQARNERLAPDERFELADGVSYLAVETPTFLMLDGEQITRYFTAAWGLCQFDMRGDTVKAMLIVGDGRNFDVATNTVTRFGKQSVGPYPLPIPMPDQPSWADLPTLFRWLREPWLYNGKSVGRSIDTFIAAVVPIRFSAYCSQRLSEGDRTLILHDGFGGVYVIRSESHEARPDGRLALTKAEVEHTKPDLDRPIRYLAERAEIIARPVGGNDAAIEVRLIGNASTPILAHYPRADDYAKPKEKDTFSLDGLLLPDAIKAEMSGITRQTVTDLSVDMNLTDDMLDMRFKLRRDAERFQRKVAVVINSRLALCNCFLVTVLMGAALGVVFRGAQVLAAMGLSVVPLAIVLLMTLMGRQLGQHAGTEVAGLLIIWGGLLVVAIADFFILKIGVRR